jgi:hypothetical protein
MTNITMQVKIDQSVQPDSIESLDWGHQPICECKTNPAPDCGNPADWFSTYTCRACSSRRSGYVCEPHRVHACNCSGWRCGGCDVMVNYVDIRLVRIA